MWGAIKGSPLISDNQDMDVCCPFLRVSLIDFPQTDPIFLTPHPSTRSLPVERILPFFIVDNFTYFTD